MKNDRLVLFCAAVVALTNNWALGVLNNGFNTDYLYAVQTAWKVHADAGDVLIYNENTGAYVGKAVDFVKDPDPDKHDEGWETITFAYDSNGNARMYVAREMDPALGVDGKHYDAEIAEYNASGGLVKKVELADTFLGTSHLGEKVKCECIRFSTYPGHSDSLFIAVLTNAGPFEPVKIYEVNLALTVLKNVYTGPVARDYAPRIEFNPNTGRMYVIAGALNETNKELGRADLVAFNYAPPGTNPSTYTTLINGKVFARRDDKDTLADPIDEPAPREQVSIWHTPLAIVYRGTDHEDGRETALIPSTWHWQNMKMPCNEFYLDQTDSENNLVRRNTFYNNNYYVSNGQLDRMTGSIWLSRLYGYNTTNPHISSFF